MQIVEWKAQVLGESGRGLAGVSQVFFENGPEFMRVVK